MRQKVTLDLTKKETGEKFSIDFYSVEKIDKYINTLQVMRGELERKIEMEKQRKAQKRNKRVAGEPKVFVASSLEDALKGNFIELSEAFGLSDGKDFLKAKGFSEISVEEEEKLHKELLDSCNELPDSMKIIMSPLVKAVERVYNEFIKSHTK